MWSTIFGVVLSILTKVFNVFAWRKWHGVNEVDMNTLKIVVKMGDKVVPLEIHPEMCIGRVKDVLARKIGMKPHEIRVIFAGRELDNSMKVGDCDIGQHSVIHAVKGLQETVPKPDRTALIANVLSQKLTEDLSITSCSEEMKKVHFFVYCTNPCKNVCPGKLRVKCAKCKLGTLTVEQDPACWDDVLIPGRISGICLSEDCDGNIAEFYFKCANHSSQDDDCCVVLHMIRPNLSELPCLACMDISNPILVFSCEESHLLCIACFQAYCISRLDERRFVQDAVLGYTLPCPIGCESSLIKETHHFKLLGDEQYSRYQKFGAEECLLQAGGVLCPKPGCGAGILPDAECRRVICEQKDGIGCGFVFCKYCLQGYHIGDCLEEDLAQNEGNSSAQNDDRLETDRSRWDKASKLTIKVITKPCPKCRTPTERDGGCMHILCMRPQCGFHWCWICQTEWNRTCMGNHWFG